MEEFLTAMHGSGSTRPRVVLKFLGSYGGQDDLFTAYSPLHTQVSGAHVLWPAQL
jgi:hypothetical protein